MPTLKRVQGDIQDDIVQDDKLLNVHLDGVLADTHHVTARLGAAKERYLAFGGAFYFASEPQVRHTCGTTLDARHRHAHELPLAGQRAGA